MIVKFNFNILIVKSFSIGFYIATEIGAKNVFFVTKNQVFIYPFNPDKKCMSNDKLYKDKQKQL